jgi:2-keto-4-pentenoate hydratase/2-oxohepta-3-ene-1,7-dioic acid hydratase in catechol pathway
MKLRRVLTEGGACVEAQQTKASAWVQLSTLAALDDIQQRFETYDLATNLLSVLTLGKDGWQWLAHEVDQAIPVMSNAHVILPYQPLSFRDFLLFEQHFIDASRGFVKRFVPRQYKFISYYEALTKKTHPRLKPAAIWYKQPLYYLGNHLNFISSGMAIHTPSYTNALDYELELGAILAKPLINASPEEAEKAIGGYVVLNDVSARDVQMAEMRSGFGPQKSKHFLNAMSSVVITADEIQDRVSQLQGSVAIDGTICARCTTSSMQYSLGEAIAYVSRDEQLHIGELFGSGTLPGGSGMENDHWVNKGQQLCLEIDAIDKLINAIA